MNKKKKAYAHTHRLISTRNDSSHLENANECERKWEICDLGIMRCFCKCTYKCSQFSYVTFSVFRNTIMDFTSLSTNAREHRFTRQFMPFTYVLYTLQFFSLLFFVSFLCFTWLFFLDALVTSIETRMLTSISISI